MISLRRRKKQVQINDTDNYEKTGDKRSQDLQNQIDSLQKELHSIKQDKPRHNRETTSQENEVRKNTIQKNESPAQNTDKGLNIEPNEILDFIANAMATLQEFDTRFRRQSGTNSTQMVR